jgi:PAS domain S-box-containing protein
MGLRDVLATGELAGREPSPVDVAAERDAYRRLARQTAGSPAALLRAVAAEAAALCRAGTAGVSVLDTDGRGARVFRWAAVAGDGAALAGRTVPADDVPCGVAVTAREPQLFRHPDRFFTALAGLGLPMHEALVVPLPEGSRRPGTLWVVSHEPGCRFTATEVETLRGLADFAAAAIGQAGQLRRPVGDTDELAELADAMPQLVWMARPDGTVDYYNRLYAEYTGFAANVDGTFAWTPALHPDDIERTSAAWRHATATGEPYEVEHRVRRGGEWRWHVSRAEPVLDEAGRVVRWYGTAIDIHDQRVAMDALRTSEERVRLLADNMAQLAWITDARGAFLWYNRRWVEYTGLDVPADGGWNWTAAHDPAHLPRVLEGFRAALDHGTPWEDTFPLRGRDGRYRWFLSRAVPIRDEQGRITRWFGTSTDVEAQRQAEADREKFVSLVERSSDLIGFATIGGQGVYLNRAGAELLGLAHPGGVAAVHLMDLLAEPARPLFREQLLPTVQAGGHWKGEVALRHVGTGELVPADLTVFALDDPATGEPQHIAVVARDIREHKRIEAQLRDADRRKDEFLATLAHELRNPLAPIRTGLQLLRLAGSDPATGARTLDMMERQMGQLVRLTDDLLDVSRITRGRIGLRRERTTLAAVVQSAVETSSPLVQGAGHVLRVSLPPEPVPLDADLTRLAQALVNLLNNAVRYTPAPGRIDLVAVRGDGLVRIGVRDTGVGIEPDTVERLFEMFAQGDGDRTPGGLGIGLALARRLVELHGGTLEAHSEGRGHGAEFVITLPVANVATPERRGATRGMPTAPPAVGRRVLVVDDNRDAAESLAEMLKLMGHAVRVAFDGRVAVALAEVELPEVVLLDLGMPDLDGFETARRVRALPGGHALELVALTGWGEDQAQRRSREAGFDRHLVKPVEPAELARILAVPAAAPA